MRRAALTLTVFVTVALAAATAFGWGFGTHAYIAKEIGKRGGDPNLMEVYGATLPDMFNFAFDSPCEFDDLYTMTHDTDFLDVYDTKNRGLEKWVAAGLVMHNQQFGMDYTAHIESAHLGLPGGFVNFMASTMDAALMDAWAASPSGAPIYPLEVVLAGLGMDPDPDTVHELYHTIIEYAADLVLRQAVPEVGPTLYAAATFYPADQYPLVMVEAFADDVSGTCGISMGEAEVFLTATETAHRQVVAYEAYLLSITDPMDALLATADHLATIGMGYLGLPYDEATHAMFAQLSAGYMQVAMAYFLDDYFEELAATMDLVQQNMIDNGIIKK